MLCKHPFYRDPSGRILRAAVGQHDSEYRKELILRGTPFPCGQCLACRINRRRVWTHRMMLESYKHDASVFITLTYRDEDLPISLSGKPTLCVRDVQLFIKRLRFMFSKRFGSLGRFRYYICGEYGPQTARPHYHGILFGVSEEYADWIKQAWGHGDRFDCKPVVEEMIQYVAGYVTKKVVKRAHIDDRVPEFSRMSLKPAIGVLAIPELIHLFKTNSALQKAIADTGDIPSTLRHGQRLMPFGRYLSNKLREGLGLEDDAALQRYFKEMLGKQQEFSHLGKGLVQGLLDESKPKLDRITARSKIFSQRGAL